MSACYDDKKRAELEAWEQYKATHDANGHAAETYPDNREGRRAMARTWKNVPPGIYHRGGV